MKNKTEILIGGEGTGMSYHRIIPCILQNSSNYIVTDPKSELLKLTGKCATDSTEKKKGGYDEEILCTV